MYTTQIVECAPYVAGYALQQLLQLRAPEQRSVPEVGRIERNVLAIYYETLADVDAQLSRTSMFKPTDVVPRVIRMLRCVEIQGEPQRRDTLPFIAV